MVLVVYLASWPETVRAVEAEGGSRLRFHPCFLLLELAMLREWFP